MEYQCTAGYGGPGTTSTASASATPSNADAGSSVDARTKPAFTPARRKTVSAARAGSTTGSVSSGGQESGGSNTTTETRYVTNVRSQRSTTGRTARQAAEPSIGASNNVAVEASAWGPATSMGCARWSAAARRRRRTACRPADRHRRRRTRATSGGAAREEPPDRWVPSAKRCSPTPPSPCSSYHADVTLRPPASIVRRRSWVPAAITPRDLGPCRT